MASLSAPSPGTPLTMGTRTGQYNDTRNQIGMHLSYTVYIELKQRGQNTEPCTLLIFQPVDGKI